MFEFRKEQRISVSFVIVFTILVFILVIPVSTNKAAAASKKLYFKNISSNTVVKVGKTLKIRYGTSKKYKNKKIGFRSSNKKVATVSKKGVIRGKKKGTVKITIYIKKKKSVRATVTIHVKNVPKRVKSIRITGNRTLVKGTTARLKATVAPANAANKKVKWKSSNKSIVKVSGDGKLTAGDTGSARITATAKDGSRVSKSVTVHVIKLNRSFTRFIAHRGYHTGIKENTAAAFEAAGAQGFWGCECDIWETARNTEGEFDIVISHDNTFKRVFGCGGGKTYEMTAETIQKNVPEACFLDEYLQICKKTGMVPVIEIKYDYDNSTGMSNTGISKVLNKVNEADLLNKAHFISFHPGTLVRLKKAAASEYNAKPYTAYLMSDTFLKENQKSDKPDYMKAISSAAANKFTAVSFKKTELTKERAEACRKKGLKVEAWTFNNGDENLVSITTNATFW